MKIVIDDNSGFCFGVVRAITRAERELSEKGYVNSLGDIVHNEMEVNRLRDMGLQCITIDKLSEVRGNTIFIRAHGEPPCVYDKIRNSGFNIVDATCPVVAKLQNQVREAYNMMQEVDGQVLILGKRGHAEVVGLAGQIDNKCIIVQSEEELIESVDFSRPIFFLSQTTQPLTLFNRMRSIIEERGQNITIHDTICRNVSNREPLLREFAPRFDLVLFVAGSESSNGEVLYQVCKSVNSNSYKIERGEDVDASLLEGVNSVGICGATSTPRWLMQQVVDYISKIAER